MTDWTKPLDERLRALWMQRDPRLSSNDIARAMNITKNAVVGRVHRLKLPARASPIRTRADGVRPLVARGAAVVQRARQESAAALVRAKALPMAPAGTLSSARPAGGGSHSLPPPATPFPAAHRAPGRPDTAGASGAAGDGGDGVSSSALPPASPTPGVLSPRRCRWPMWGDTERATHRYCDGPIACGSYCAAHAARAYAVPRERQHLVEQDPVGLRGAA